MMVWRRRGELDRGELSTGSRNEVQFEELRGCARLNSSEENPAAAGSALSTTARERAAGVITESGGRRQERPVRRSQASRRID